MTITKYRTTACDIPPMLFKRDAVSLAGVKRNQDLLRVINEYDAALEQCEQDKQSAIETIRISNDFKGNGK